MLTWLEESQTPWPQFWHDWNGGAAREGFAMSSPNKAHYQGDDFKVWNKALSAYMPTSQGPSGGTPASLLYDEIGALWAPINDHDDWSAFDAKINSYVRP
jgi:hypothetical protein